MENFIGKVIKIVSGDKGVSKDYWIDDSKCKACYECEAVFNQFNRRHHCRICGRVFCGSCTRNSIPPPRESADQQWLRVCNYCYRVRQRSDQPAVRVHDQHAGSRGPGGAAISHSGSLRQLPDAGPLGSPASVDVGWSVSAAGRSGAASGRWARSQSSVHRVSSGDLSWAVPPQLEDDFGMSLADRDARLLYQQQLEAGALPPDAPLQANSLAEVHRQLFCASADAHLRAVVQQLLMVESVPQPEVWAPIVSGAAQAVAAYLSPTQMYTNGQHDPRQSLKVKKVADVGQPEDTGVVTGVVVRKGLVHRKMRSYIEYPKVLLLAGSLEYQRDTNKLSSFDLMDHDKQYLANAVARLSVLKPDVLLVEGSVARMAQEDLLSRNISVAQKIKAKVLERLARAMGVRVTPTVEHLTPATAHLYLGDCKVFRVEAETMNVSFSGSTTAVAAPSAAAAPSAVTGPGTTEVPAAAAAPAPGRSDLEAASEGVDGAAVEEPPLPSLTPANAVVAPSAQHQVPADPGPQAAADQAATGPAAPYEPPPSPGGAGGAAEAAASMSAPSTSPRPTADDQQAKYTSLSAAMMMKALGSGPNAAAAVACVSGGNGVAGSALPFRPWASSSAPTQASLQPAPSSAPAPCGGQGGRPSALPEERSLAPVTPPVATGPQPALGRTGPAPVPPGPPAPPQVTLMYFEGCRPTTCTVLLKGAGLELLKKLKPVVGFAVLTAWNQRLESAFLADLLTAAVAAAGEEAYVAWAGPTNNTSASSATGASSLPAAPSFGPSASVLSGTSSLCTVSYSSPALSLGSFRQHAEQAIRASIAAASACGAPGILLSISPHCNAWDESLIAEWEQQGFTFPHLHHHHNNHNRGDFQGDGSQRALQAGLHPQSQPQEHQPHQQPAATGAEGWKACADQAVDTAVPTAGAATTAAVSNAADETALVLELSLAVALEVGDAEARSGQQPTDADGSGRMATQQQPHAAEDIAEASQRVLDAFAPPDAASAPSATTRLSPFAAAPAAVPANGDAAVAAQPGSGPQFDRVGSANGQLARPTAESPSVPSGPLDASTAIAARQGDVGAEAAAGAAAATELPPAEVSGQGVSAAAGAEAATEVPPGEVSGRGLSAAGPAQAAVGPGTAAASTESESGEDRQPQAAPATGPACQGEQERDQQQLQPRPRQQQSAVKVLQGQRIYSHQRIFVTCMFRRSRDRNLCDPFQVKQIDYYHRSSDVPLIRYIKMCTQLGWTCPGLGCPEPFTAHESVFFFGCHKLTIFYATLPPIQALPGEEKNQIWHWTRPIGRGREGAAACRRVPLSQDACYISMGRFLELSFSADGLDVFGRSLHYDHVRYFGLGRTLVCMFPERTNVYVMQLPDVVMSYSHQAQAKWLRQEGAELVQEASDAFDLIELMLAESPHFGSTGGGWDAAPAALPPPQAAAATGDVAAESTGTAASTGFTPGTSPGTAAGTVSAVTPTVSSVLTTLLVAVRKDRQSFQTLLADCLARCAPPTPPPAAGAIPWDEQVTSGVRELNRLRTVLAKAVLQWASRLQDPAGFMAHYSRVTSGGGGAGPSGRPVQKSQPLPQPQAQPVTLQPQPQQQPLAQPVLSSSPRGTAPVPGASLISGPEVAAAAAAAATTAAAPAPHPAQPLLEQPSITISEGSLSLFGSTPSVAAFRLGLVAGHAGAPVPPSETGSFTSAAASELTTEQPPQNADTTTAHALPIPIVPHAQGPLSVHAVAEMVAQQELRGGGELLEGSRSLLVALAGPAASATAASASGAAPQAAPGRAGHSRGASRNDVPASAAPLAVAGGAASSPGASAAGHGDGGAAGSSGRSAAQTPGTSVLAATGSSKRLSAAGRLSTGGGGIPGLDAAAVAAATTVVGPGLGGHPPAAVQGCGGGPRGSSLPRSTSVSTIGDMGDMSYLAGIGGDSGAEDNGDGEEGREEADDEEPDHDTFLAFMGSAPRGRSALHAGTCAGGPGRSAAEGRNAAAGGRGAMGADIGEDVADEVADGAYYYRALFSHGVGAGEEAAAAPQALLQPPQPLLSVQPLQPQHAHQHSVQPQDENEEQRQAQAQHQPHAAAQSGQPIAISLSAAAQAGGIAGSAAHSPRGAVSGGALGQIPAVGPMPLVSAAEALGGGSAAAAAVTTVFSRRQLMVQVRRRLEAVATATVGGGALARGFIPLPGRATLPPGVNDTCIPIFDSEPTSIIAYALSTRAYQQQINAGYKAIFGKARTENNRERDREAAGAQLPQAAPVPLVEVSQQPQPPPASAASAAAGAGAHGPLHGANSAAASGSSAAGTVPVSAQPANVMAPTAPAAAAANAAGPAAIQAPSAAAASPPRPPPPAPSPPPPLGPLGASPDAEWWTVLTSKEACHVRVVFEDEARSMPWARARFTVTAHFAPQFAELRRRCIQGGEAAFVASMCRCRRWESRGGKSNAYFAKTRDDRYIIKSLSKSEKASFMNFAPHYFAHMGRHLLNRDAPTCLAKILGVYSVAFKPEPGTSGLESAGGGGPVGAAASAALIKELKDREFSQDLLVMENCFYDRPVARIYDLKGSERNRFNADAASRPEDHLEVHLDDNLRRTMHTNPIFVDARSRHRMEAAVWADTAFLAGQDVMDYSMLVGVDKENGVLALAIIDFIRQYTWDKQLETWVKSSGMLGGNGKEPTIISPKQYMRRFRAAMQQYFTAVPGSAGSEVPKDPDAAA